MLDAGRRRRHATIIRELDIPAPFDLTEFTARLERRRHRPIRLCPFRSGPGVPCGVWIATADADYVYHEQGTTRFHVNLIVLHEIAHMLLGHQGLPGWQNLARQIAPDVHPGLVRLLLGRSAYALPEEREAETLASRILARTTSWPGAGGRFGVPAGFARAPRCDDRGPADLTAGCGRSGGGGCGGTREPA